MPEQKFRMLIDSHTRETRALEKLFYENLPSMKEYTASYMNRLLPCFEELCYLQHQTISKASKDPSHVYLVAEGSVRLISNDNPFDKP